MGKEIELPKFFKFIEKISELTGYLSGLLIFIASLNITVQVILRYMFGFTTVWQMELTVYFLMFATFVGAAYGLKHGAHVRVDIVANLFGARKRALLYIITSILSMCVTLIIGFLAWKLWVNVTQLGWHSDSAWGPSLKYPYFILPLGMTLISLQYISIIYQSIVEFQRLKGVE